MNELISVIVPVYNVEIYLKECLDSIISQTYLALEIIIIDDGSTDKSFEICKNYENRDSRVVLIHKENGGISSARNIGLDNAKGKYIVFIDPDDIVETDYIEFLYSMIKKNETDIAMCGHKRFKHKIKKCDIIYETRKISNKECLQEILYQHNQTAMIVSPWGKIYKKEIFNNITYPEGRINEDLYIIGEILNMCNEISVNDTAKYYYRIREKSITEQGFKKNRMDIIFASKNVLEYVKKEFPEIINSAISMLYSRSVEMLTEIYMSGEEHKKEQKELWNIVKEYRIITLLDYKSRIINKISALCSFFGHKFLVTIHSKYRNIKRNKI